MRHLKDVMFVIFKHIQCTLFLITDIANTYKQFILVTGSYIEFLWPVGPSI